MRPIPFMKKVRPTPLVSSWFLLAGLAVKAAAAQPLVVNGSFELDDLPPWPGYGPITGWTPGGSIGTSYGINGAFVDNGVIPDGTKVAFLQSSGLLSQVVSGFTVGAQYWLTYRENARFGCCGGTALLTVTVDGIPVIAEHTVNSVGGTNVYRTVGSDVFTAGASNLTVAFVKAGEYDVTALIDDVRIVEVPPNTAPMVTQQPRSQVTALGETVSFTSAAVGSALMFFQWRFHGIDLPGQTNTTLTLTNVNSSYSGAYSFLVSNAAGAATSSVATLTVRADGPLVINPGFERDALPTFPGYGPITGWTPGGEIGTSYGINEANGAFADNAEIPQGRRVCFMQHNGTLSQNVSGFVVGEPYWLTYRENMRGSCCGERTATLSVLVNGAVVVAEHPLTVVGGYDPYWLVTSDLFIATAANLMITFVKGGTGDGTALIDDIRILTRNSVKLRIALQHGNVPILQIEGIPNRMATIEYKDSLAPGAAWQVLTNFLLTGESALWVVDNSVPAFGQRFYQARQ